MSSRPKPCDTTQNHDGHQNIAYDNHIWPRIIRGELGTGLKLLLHHSWTFLDGNVYQSMSRILRTLSKFVVPLSMFVAVFIWAKLVRYAQS